MAMDIYSRVSELIANKKRKITDKEFFSGKEYLSFIKRKTENIITGSFYTLNKMGFNISKAEETKLLNSLSQTVEYDTDNPVTAYCASSDNGMQNFLHLNAGNELVQLQEDRIDKHNAVLGMLYHEIGHLLFTDYPTSRAWVNQLLKGIWFPKAPDNLNTVNGINLSAKMSDKDFLNVLVHCAKHINNAIEDGYIEREIREICPGKGRECLATINESLLLESKTLEETVNDEKCSDFASLMNQILLYSKFGEMNIGEYDGELMDPLYEAIDIIDDISLERDPLKRVTATNELLCILFPYLEKDIEEEMQKQQQQQQSQGQQGQQGQSGGSSAQQGAMNNIMNNIDNIAQQAGASNQNGNCMSKSYNNPSKNQNGNAPAKQQGNQNGNDSSDGAGQSGTGAGGGQSSADSAAERDITNILNQMATNSANSQAEKERTKELNAESQNIDCSVWGYPGSCSVEIKRAAEVSDYNKSEYNKNAETFVRISKDLQRGIKRILQDRREGGKRKNLPFGRRLEVSSIVHDDGKYFSKTKLPTESPKLGVAVLVDESGSTSGELINAATMASIVVEDFCRELKIPHIINGYTSGSKDALIYSYAEPNEIDGGNRYRITGMSARGGTPTKAALTYMCSRMQKLPVDVKLLIVISDGCSQDNRDYTDNGSYSKATAPIMKIINRARKENIIVVAAGIGNNRREVEDEFGSDNFLDITNLEEMPEKLIQLIKANLWV